MSWETTKPLVSASPSAATLSFTPSALHVFETCPETPGPPLEMPSIPAIRAHFGRGLGRNVLASARVSHHYVAVPGFLS